VGSFGLDRMSALARTGPYGYLHARVLYVLPPIMAVTPRQTAPYADRRAGTGLRRRLRSRGRNGPAKVVGGARQRLHPAATGPARQFVDTTRAPDQIGFKATEKFIATAKLASRTIVKT